MSCGEWLVKKLKNKSWVLCDDIRNQAREEGYSKKQLKEARKKLGVKTFHQFDYYGATANWFWKL